MHSKSVREKRHVDQKRALYKRPVVLKVVTDGVEGHFLAVLDEKGRVRVAHAAARRICVS